MGFELKKESYSGGIKAISIGKGASAITVGGQTCYPFYTFEGNMPNQPKIAMEIWDIAPEDWPEPVMAHFKDVFSDPAAWAKKCVEKFGAEIIVLQLKSADPNDKNASPESVAETVLKVLKAINVPLIVWGCANPAKDEAVLKVVAEKCEGYNLVMGPVEEKNYKGIGAAAMGYGHAVISSSPIDVNLAKQVNILLENLGMPMDRVIVDPTTGGLGYGMEYSYSVMERLTMAAMVQGDEKLQFPMINNLGNEVWKCKEARQKADDAPILGDPEKRGVMMEAIGAVSYLLAGSSLLIMRHPEAIRLTKEFINALSGGGSLKDSAAIAKVLAEANIDFAALAPTPDLTIAAEEKKAAPAAKKAAPAAPAAAAPASAKPAAAPAPSAPVKEEAKAPAQPAADPAAQAKAEADAKVAAEAKVAADAKAKADAEVKAKADEAAQAKAAADALAADKARRDEDEKALMRLRAQARQAADEAAASSPDADEEVTMTAAAVQKDQQEKILDMLDRFHRRNR
ncbi:MAG: acetyl-CoA decarbonylase/synthase complex subunit delta [Proteobacteria bacterium]|nr:acetyl-CoA decarbonylase/synthase complex subunit delta [Pseudomonadota bacterium]